MGYTDPQAFFQAVIDGQANMWSIVNFPYLFEILRMSFNSMSERKHWVRAMKAGCGMWFSWHPSLLATNIRVRHYFRPGLERVIRLCTL